MELEKIAEAAKKLGAGSVKYVKYSYVPATSTYHVKIYVPHAHALRLDLKKK